MNPKQHLEAGDLRSAARLATEATAGLADLVEAMHANIASLPGLQAAPADGRTSGITGLVYKTVRGVTRLVGGSVDALLGLLGPALAQEGNPSPEREAVLAALNGVLGDHLTASGNPLATTMTLRRAGCALPLERASLARDLPDASGHLLLLVHGLCMNDLQWQRSGQDHGAALARDLGCTAVYLRYCSGLHISSNGRALAQLLQSLVEAWPRPLQRITLLGHSMGGLVLRSAVHRARAMGLDWPQRVNEIVFLGTPHHGAPLERAGHGVDLLLGLTRYTAPFVRLGQLRSAGITDLRHGHLLADDRVGADPAVRGSEAPLPLPLGVACYTVAATLGERPGALREQWVGDGLVPLDSALGRHADPPRRLNFAPNRQWMATDTGHLDLLSSPQVYAQLRQWLAEPPPPSPR